MATSSAQRSSVLEAITQATKGKSADDARLEKVNEKADTEFRVVHEQGPPPPPPDPVSNLSPQQQGLLGKVLGLEQTPPGGGRPQSFDIPIHMEDRPPPPSSKSSKKTSQPSPTPVPDDPVAMNIARRKIQAYLTHFATQCASVPRARPNASLAELEAMVRACEQACASGDEFAMTRMMFIKLLQIGEQMAPHAANLCPPPVGQKLRALNGLTEAVAKDTSPFDPELREISIGFIGWFDQGPYARLAFKLGLVAQQVIKRNEGELMAGAINEGLKTNAGAASKVASKYKDL